MTGGVRGGGFFAGAVGGLALAILLVGIVSFLPPSNIVSQAESGVEKYAASSGPASQTATSTTSISVASTTTALSTTSTATQAGAQNAAASSASAAPSVTATTTVSSSASASSPALSDSNRPVIQGGLSAAGGAPGQQRPNSALTALPGESIGSLLATLSPLLIGLLVAVLIYGAYSRRQDSS